jgi:hypothetical protein
MEVKQEKLKIAVQMVLASKEEEICRHNEWQNCDCQSNMGEKKKDRNTKRKNEEKLATKKLMKKTINDEFSKSIGTRVCSAVSIQKGQCSCVHFRRTN